MNPCLQTEILKEQVQLENRARRNYPKKWGELNATKFYKVCNQNEMNNEIKNTIKVQCPYEYKGEGDSYFVSKDMYNSLVAKCRCGRPRTGVHVVKCLQKAINGQHNLDDNKQQNTETKTGAIDGSNLKVPPTSNAAIGWSNGQEMRYKKWEQSMKYISPVFTMEGPRITATPYNVLIIG